MTPTLFRVGAFFVLLGRLASGETITSTSGNLSAAVEADGMYQVSAKDSGWQLKGTLPGAAKDVVSSDGQDALGDYRQIAFQFSDTERPMTGFIRVYREKDLILFSQTLVKASPAPPAPFPNFTTVPPNLFPFSFHDTPFSPPRFALEKISTPWLLFDAQNHALILSPASHFVCSSMVGDGKTELASGFNSRLKNIPAGFTQQSLLALTTGINHAWDIWGKALTDLQGKKRPANDSDPVVKYLGYWTDNGGAYWYNYDQAKGYQGTLQALVESYRAEQIPIRYLQLDSWWYSKTLIGPDGKIGKSKNSKLPEGEWNRYGGTTSYTAHPFIFPKGMEAFHKSTDLPFVTHNRWIDPSSPYHQHYKISGIAAVDPGFWNEIATYLSSNGVMCYEQDWTSAILAHSPELQSTVDEGDAFFDNMAKGCRDHGLSVQYCMETPPAFLEGSRYDNLTSIRVCDDKFGQPRYHDFLYVSRFAAALGIWPWTDVFKSTETSNLLLSTLSAGPVGNGDLIGMESKANLMLAARADGVLVKPDVPLMPVDAAYIAEAQKQNVPNLATTYTNHDGLKTTYIALVKTSRTGPDTLATNTSDFGCTGPAYLYDYFHGTGQKVDKGQSLTLARNGQDSAFFIVAPIGASGIAFLGDAGKFVGTGKKRISSLKDENSKLVAEVDFAANEASVNLRGYAQAAPQITILGGTAKPVAFDDKTGIFTLSVSPDSSQVPQDAEGDPIRKATITLSVGKN